MYGVLIEEGISDWQILQHRNGQAKIGLKGRWTVPKAAVEVGVRLAEPVIRIVSEDDNHSVLPWTKTVNMPEADGLSGQWSMELTVPAGGLYRIETSLETWSHDSTYHWMFRGDVRFHVGAGDVFIVAGQSNSAGYGRDSGWDPPELGVHLFRNRHAWDLACHPINECTGAQEGGNSELGVSGTSPYIAFGKTLRRVTGYPVGLVSCALGGSPIERWDRRAKGDLFNAMLVKLQECGMQFAGVLWYQGCSDANPANAPKYGEAFEAVVGDLRKELGYDIPFFTYQLNRMRGNTDDCCWGVVREAQRRAAQEISNVYLMPTLQCGLSDLIHNNSHSNAFLGEATARLCAEVLYQEPAYRAPELKNAFLTDGKTLCLTFDHVVLGLENFSGKPGDGFTVKDREGEIPVSAWAFTGSELTLSLEREAGEDCVLSYGWQADPLAFPLADMVTFLPLVSFFEMPIRKNMK